MVNVLGASIEDTIKYALEIFEREVKMYKHFEDQAMKINAPEDSLMLIQKEVDKHQQHLANMKRLLTDEQARYASRYLRNPDDRMGDPGYKERLFAFTATINPKPAPEEITTLLDKYKEAQVGRV